MSAQMIVNEKEIEQWIVNILQEWGYSEKDNFEKNVIDYELLKNQMQLINQSLDPLYIETAIKKIQTMSFSEQEANFEGLQLIKYGVKVCVEKISNVYETVKLVDFNNIANNRFEYIQQLRVPAQENKTIIPDVVIYLNGLPVSIIEIKSPDGKEDLENAYYQVRNYINFCKDFLYWNIFAVVSNLNITKYGTNYAEYNRWSQWRSNNQYSQIGIYNYGFFEKKTFLNILENYVFFAKAKNKYTKYVPMFHQYNAVEKTVEQIAKIESGKGGVVWHTQGAGKSVTMLFLAKRIKQLTTNTKTPYQLIYVTDRNELDDQLFQRFSEAQDTYLFSVPKNLTSRQHLKDVLSEDGGGGIYFTTIQKFTETQEPLSTKTNIIIISDEAHRSHNNIEAELVIDQKNKEIISKAGYEKYIRDAFPNAIYLGFTGTPLVGDRKNTTTIFGNYIDIYTMSQAVADGTTVPIFYEPRFISTLLDNDKLTEIDEIYEAEKKDDQSTYVANDRHNFIKNKLINIANILANPNKIKALVKDFWTHYQKRMPILNGKAMFVAFNRKIAFLIYQEMLAQKPNFFKDEIKLVITKSNKDSEDLRNSIPSDEEKKAIAAEFKSDQSTIKIVVVVDMWLTGFDVPDLDTIYLFKVIKYHNLMQTIARVNRNYANKEQVKQNGLVVDYLNISKHIEEALKSYTKEPNQVFDTQKIKEDLLEKCTSLREKFLGATLVTEWLTSAQQKRWKCFEQAVNTVIGHACKDSFFQIVTKLHFDYNLCLPILKREEKEEAMLYIFVKNLIRNLTTKEDVDVQATCAKLRVKLDECIQAGNVQVAPQLIEISKDISGIVQEMKAYQTNALQNKTTNHLQMLTWRKQIHQQISLHEQVNPIVSKKLSEELIALIKRYEQNPDAQMFTTGLLQMAVTMQQQQQSATAATDQKVQSFCAILADEQYHMPNWNAATHLQIANQLVAIMRRNYSFEWNANQSVRDQTKLAIKTLLAKDYAYPQNKLTNLVQILFDHIEKIIKNDPTYFQTKETE